MVVICRPSDGGVGLGRRDRIDTKYALQQCNDREQTDEKTAAPTMYERVPNAARAVAAT